MELWGMIVHRLQFKTCKVLFTGSL